MKQLNSWILMGYVIGVFTPNVIAEILTNEKDFAVLPGQRIQLKGDSITKGYGFGNYTNPSPLRTIYDMANILMKANLPQPPPMRPTSFIWEGLNPDGTPKTVDSLAAEIQVYVRSGEFRTGDWLIYEDAGGLNDFVHPAPNPSTNQMYRRYREALRDMVLEAETVIDREHIRFMTMFDYNPSAPWCKWDAPLDDGGRTGNDAIRDEAAALGVRVIDMNRVMDRSEKYIEDQKWGRLVGRDGIHPNIYGNFVMTLTILESLGADIARWKLDGLYPHFRHPAAGGDVETVWGFTKDPTDAERVELLEELRKIVVKETGRTKEKPSKQVTPKAVEPKLSPSAHSFRRLIRHGRLLGHPTTQPIGTDKPASYEIAKIFQLDKDTAFIVTSLREQGGHDFEIGNDGIIFRKLSDIVPERAFPVNRLETNYTTRAGQKAVLAKYGVNGIVIPLGAKLEDGRPHPAAGTGFMLSTLLSFTPDRNEVTPNADQFVEFYQVRWDGNELKIDKDKLPEPYASDLLNVGFNATAKGESVLCPVVTHQGIEVLLFERKDGRWQPTKSGGNFATVQKSAKIKLEKVGAGGKQFALVRGEIEPSLVRMKDGYMILTRGPDVDPTGRLYWSTDGLKYYLKSDHWNHTVPQALNQGLDESLYLTTNTGPGFLRNPLYAFAIRGLSPVEPIIIHDEKQIRHIKGKEVPFVDHGKGANIFLEGRWRHFITYRVLDLRETNGEGAPPKPQTGLYLAEFEYDTVTRTPFRF